MAGEARLDAQPVHGAQHRVRARRRVRLRAGRGRDRRAGAAAVSVGAGPHAGGLAPAHAGRGRAARPRLGGGNVRGHRRRRVLDQRGGRDRGGRRRPCRPVPGAARGQPGLSYRGDALAPGTRCHGPRPSLRAGRCPVAARHRRGAERHQRPRRAERALPAGSAPARRPPHHDRSRPAALREPRILQRRARRPLARGVQRTHRGPAGRAAHRLQADQQQPGAVRNRARRQPAAAGDLRRRREVHPWRHAGPAGREGHVLPHQPRHSQGRGAQPADLWFRGRDHRSHGNRATPGAARPAHPPPAAGAGAGM